MKIIFPLSQNPYNLRRNPTFKTENILTVTYGSEWETLVQRSSNMVTSPFSHKIFMYPSWLQSKNKIMGTKSVQMQDLYWNLYSKSMLPFIIYMVYITFISSQTLKL